jgi:hypothetical protein
MSYNHLSMLVFYVILINNLLAQRVTIFSWYSPGSKIHIEREKFLSFILIIRFYRKYKNICSEQFLFSVNWTEEVWSDSYRNPGSGVALRLIWQSCLEGKYLLTWKGSGKYMHFITRTQLRLTSKYPLEKKCCISKSPLLQLNISM